MRSIRICVAAVALSVLGLSLTQAATKPTPSNPPPIHGLPGKPTTKPAPKPTTKPSHPTTKPAPKPTTKPSTCPTTKPTTRPQKA